MDLIDLWWNVSQESQLRDVRKQVERIQIERDQTEWSTRDLAAENAELKLRLGLLVRLLVAKGVFQADEYAALLAQARPKTGDGA